MFEFIYNYLIDKNILFNLSLIFFNWYFIDDFNILLLLISLDNVSYAVDFMINNINKNLSYNEIINENNKLYLMPTFERYLFYGTITTIYHTIKLLILRDYILYIKIILSLSSYPYINNIIYKEYLDIFEDLSHNKEKFFKIIFCEQIYNIIKKLNRIYLDDEIILDKDEIIDILYKSSNIKSEIITFIKNTLIVILLHYFKSKSLLYYKITKYIYIYNSGNYFINNIDITKARNKFITIFTNKDYVKLNDPMAIHSMLFLYYNKKTENDWITLREKINYNIITFITLWTCGSFFEGINKLIVLLFISFCIRITKKNLKNTFNKKYIISILLTIFGYYITYNIIIMSFIHQFGQYLCNNFITKGIFNTCHNNIYLYVINNYREITNILHKNFVSYIRNIIYGIIMKYLFYNNINYGYAFTLFITNLEKCMYTKLLYIIIYISIFNNKNIFKIILLSYMSTLLINLIKNINNIKNITKINTTDKNILNDNKVIIEEIKNAIESSMDIQNDNKTDENINNNDLIIIEDYIKKE